jgi:digeranylgeranylglycerophospholipid reductase
VSGKLAGEVAAVRAGDVSEAFLASYDRAWRARMEKKLLRNYLAKEKVSRLDDATFDALIESLSGLDTDASTWSLLLAVGRRHPKFVAEFSHLLLQA